MKKILALITTVIIAIVLFIKIDKKSRNDIIMMHSLPVSTLVEDPIKYDNKKVKTYGFVKTSIRLVKSAFIISDGNNDLLIITKGAVPNKGDKVVVEGVFSQELKIANISICSIKSENIKKLIQKQF